MSDTPSVLRKLAIRLLGLVVVLPVFLVTGYCTTFAVFLLPGMIYNGFNDPWGYQLNRIGLVIVLIVGLVGVNTGLKLYRHFLRSTRAPEWIGSAWAGLGCGVVANLAIMCWFPGSPWFKVFLGWPLLGCAVFALLLLQSTGWTGSSVSQKA
ncbi:hypothetical protein PRtIB026_A40470 [Pseudomonas sp. RtIB026]|uniref:hypothetical protein n=1 Tax=Pseudomonas sp. RtIB026 TaxID=2749999 RepID=UPI001942EA76|nr:hypothetical protein [Pseudomonas sp. RtIB026]BCJ06175.1 hypothetical protein PRtIB026_A40470 [Pseudomonas sp. RtIB026]